MTKRKALIYCRVSSKAQEAEGSGLQSQETRCRQHAQARGYDVVMVFPDTMTGAGSFMNRPGMVALLSYLDAQPDERFVVIFDDLKRVSRDTRAFLDLRDAFRLRDTDVECLNFKLDDTPEGEFIETIVAAQGALERKQNGRQVAQKMKARMDSGYYVLRAPLGYEYRAVKGRGKMLFPVEPFASIIREAFEGYASGRFTTQSEVTQFLETFPEFPRGKTGRVLRQKAIDILTRPIYTGYIHSDLYDVHWKEGQHEAIVSLETFHKVQERRKGAAYAPRRANVGEDFVLRGFVSCTSCNTPLRSGWSTGKTKKHPYYLCQTKGCEAYGKSIRRDDIESDVGELVKALQPSAGYIEMATAMFRQAWEARAAQAKDIVVSGKRELLRIEREIEAVLDRIMSASNDSIIRRYEDKVEMLERDRALITEKMARQDVLPDTFDEKLELALTFLSNPWKLWETGCNKVRRTVLKLAFSTRIHYCRKEGARTPEIAFSFKALEGKPDMSVCYGG